MEEATFNELHPNCNRTIQFLNDLGRTNLAAHGIDKDTVIFDAGAVCVRKDFRQYKLGTRLIEESFTMARDEGAQFYVVHAVNSFAKRIFDKFNFISANEIDYDKYFAGDEEVLSRRQAQHTSAHFLIKNIQQ